MLEKVFIGNYGKNYVIERRMEDRVSDIYTVSILFFLESMDEIYYLILTLWSLDYSKLDIILVIAKLGHNPSFVWRSV